MFCACVRCGVVVLQCCSVVHPDSLARGLKAGQLVRVPPGEPLSSGRHGHGRRYVTRACCTARGSSADRAGSVGSAGSTRAAKGQALGARLAARRLVAGANHQACRTAGSAGSGRSDGSCFASAQGAGSSAARRGRPVGGAGRALHLQRRGAAHHCRSNPNPNPSPSPNANANPNPNPNANANPNTLTL
eukprot:scaffold2728_cov56-Phaeocystis_antarctica.AAC.1